MLKNNSLTLIYLKAFQQKVIYLLRIAIGELKKANFPSQ